MKPKAKSGSFKSWIWLLIAGGILFAFWRYKQKGALIDQSALSGQFESVVDEILTAHGIQDVQIKKSVRKERRKKFLIPTLWIETEREIVVPSASLDPIIADLKSASEKFKFNTDVHPSSPSEKATILECGKGRQIFQRLIFFAPSGKIKIALVIDDIAGRPKDLEHLDSFLALKIPITFAVLPMEKLSRQTAEKIHQSGNEVIVHQPMEPEDLKNNNPGKAALLVGMNAEQIREMIERNFRSVPFAVGVSNHMGSRFTADSKEMQLFLAALKNEKAANHQPMFFFDSHTNMKSVGDKMAKEMGVPHFRNDLFLDNADELNAMLKQFAQLKKEAQKKGAAAAIGHIQRKFIVQAIRQVIPEFRKDGIEFVYLSEIVGEKGQSRGKKVAGKAAKKKIKP